jgi:hypothetical protein
MLAPTKNRSVTYQTDENHIGKTNGYLVGVAREPALCDGLVVKPAI